MCGIVGFNGDYSSKIHQFLIRGLLETESRGKDATGFFAIGENRTLDDKRPIPARKFIARAKRSLASLNSLKPHAIIAHCRQSTSGNPKNNRNNHPFIGERIAIVHNGQIPKYKTVPSFANLEFKTETDSEVILRWIEREVKDGKSIEDAIVALSVAMPDDAAYAVACVEIKTGKLFLFRNKERPLCFAKCDGDFTIFASTEEILRKSAAGATIAWSSITHLEASKLAIIDKDNINFVDLYKKPQPVVSTDNGPKTLFKVVNSGGDNKEVGVLSIDHLNDRFPIKEILTLITGLSKIETSKEEMKCALKILTQL